MVSYFSQELTTGDTADLDIDHGGDAAADVATEDTTTANGTTSDEGIAKNTTTPISNNTTPHPTTTPTTPTTSPAPAHNPFSPTDPNARWIRAQLTKYMAIVDVHGERYTLAHHDEGLDPVSLAKKYLLSFCCEHSSVQHRHSMGWNGEDIDLDSPQQQTSFLMNIASYDAYLTSQVEVTQRPAAWFHVRFMFSPGEPGFYRELRRLHMRGAGLTQRQRCDDDATAAGVGNRERYELSGSLLNIVDEIAMEAFAKAATDGGATINCEGGCMNNRSVTNVGGAPKLADERGTRRGFREGYYETDTSKDAHEKMGRMGYILGKYLDQCHYLAGVGQEFRQDEGMCRLLLKCLVFYTGMYPVDSLETIITFWGNTKATNFHYHR